MKYLPKDLIPDYMFEIKERLAIVADGEETTSLQHLEIVLDVTGEWFTDLLDEMTSRAADL